MLRPLEALERAEPGFVSGIPVSLGKSPDPSTPPLSHRPKGRTKQHRGVLREFV